MAGVTVIAGINVRCGFTTGGAAIMTGYTVIDETGVINRRYL